MINEIRESLKRNITNWFDSAKQNYNISGYFKDISIDGVVLNIFAVEEGVEYIVQINYFADFIKDINVEYLYTIWMDLFKEM